MAQRYVVQGQQPQAELRPIASPVDTFAPAIIQAPEMQNIIDLAPLSKSFTNLASAVAEKTGEEALKQGGIAYTEASADITDALKGKDQKAAADKLAALARAKKIPEHYIPQFYRGIYEFAARDQMRKYESSLKQELDKYTQVEDANGVFMPEPAESAEQVASRVWNDQFGQNPVFANYFGKQEAAKYKQTIDGNFMSAATEERAAKLKKWRETKIEDELGSIVGGLSADVAATSEAVQVKLSELRTLGVPDIQVKLTNAVLIASKQKSDAAMLAKDPEARRALFDEARNILLAADDLTVGTATLGSNATMAERLTGGLTELVRMEEVADDRDRRKTDRAFQEEERLLKDAGYKIMDELPRDLPPDERRKQFMAELNNLFQKGEIGSEFRAKAINNYNIVMEADQRAGGFSDKEVETKIAALIGGGLYDEANDELRGALKDSRITLDGFTTMTRAIEVARSAKSQLEQSPEYRAANANINTVFNPINALVSSLPIKDRVGSEISSISYKLDKELQAVMLNTELTAAQKKEKANELVTQAEKRSEAMKKGIEARQAEVRTKLEGWQYGEVSMTPQQLTALSAFLPPQEAAGYRLVNEQYNKGYEDLLAARTGPMAELTRGIRAGLSIAAAEMGEAQRGSFEINAYDALITQAIETEASRVYREEIKKGTPKIQIEKLVALASRSAALKVLDSMGDLDKTVAKQMRMAMLTPEATFRQGRVDTMDTRIEAGSRAMDVYDRARKASMFGAMGLMDENGISDITRFPSSLGVSKVDVSAAKERIAEHMAKNYWSWNINSRRELFDDVTSNVDDYPQVSANAQQAAELVSHIVTHTGLTLEETLNGKILYSGGHPEFNGVAWDTTKVNPWYTPLLLDVRSGEVTRDPLGYKYTYVPTQTLDDINEWFTEAEDLYSPQHSALTSILSKFSIEDTPDNRLKFKQAQIRAHSRLLRPSR